MIDEDLVHFTIASSIFFTIAPILVLYVGWSNMSSEERQQSKVSCATLAVMLPVVYGGLVTLLYPLMSFVPRKLGETYFRMIFTGAIVAFAIALVLEYAFDIYRQWFDIAQPYAVPVMIGIAYFMLWYTMGQWLRIQLVYHTTADYERAIRGSSGPVNAPANNGKSDANKLNILSKAS